MRVGSGGLAVAAVSAAEEAVVAVASVAEVAFVVGVNADGAAPAHATSEIANAKDIQNRTAAPMGPSVAELAKRASRPRAKPATELADPLVRMAEFQAGSRAR